MPAVSLQSVTSYTFGDTATAQDRLDVLADVFDSPSREFLATAVTSPPELACDLGCGPGNTTRMIREVTGALRVVGLDRSGAFVQSARSRAADEFRVWEAGSPLPVTAPDLIYARLLLAHLPDAPQLAASWASQLRPGGQLLLDEVERIETSSDVFGEYLAMVVARVANAGADMYAGPGLPGIALGDDCGISHDQVVAHPVPAADAARMFRLNLAVWGDDAWVTGQFGRGAVPRLSRELARIAAGEVPAGITWQLRHVAIRRDRLSRQLCRRYPGCQSPSCRWCADAGPGGSPGLACASRRR
jgi:trans-aconitate 2-methyltransferase